MYTRKIKLIVLLALLGGVTVGCTKETESDNTTIVTTTQTATYVVDGRQYYANPQTEEEWSEFLDRMVALAEEGHSVQFWRNGIRAHGTKETLTFTTTNKNEAVAWAKDKMDEGYIVTISFDEESGRYTCIAVR